MDKQLEFLEIDPKPKFVSENFIPFDRIQPSATQLMVQRLITPDSGVDRLLLNMGPGTGKTYTSLTAGKNFIAAYRSMYSGFGLMTKVFIVGFSRDVYIREFFKYPELGVITKEEIRQIQETRASIRAANEAARPILEQNLHSFQARIARRITSKEDGGFYEFYGYRELFNALFPSLRLPDDVDAANILERYKSGELVVNKQVLESFKNGYVICDEIHLAYNSKEVNNYGLALQFVLDYHGKNVFAAFLSATIINNNKRELIDVVNLIRDPGSPPFISSNYFSSEGLLKKSLEPVYAQMRGKVAFLEESNSDYPELDFMGDKINGLKFIKFTACDMTPLHEATYVAANLYTEKTAHAMIHDMVVPNPAFSAEEHAQWHPKHPKFRSRNMEMTGLFESQDVREKIMTAPAEWRKAIGIEIKVEGDKHSLSGPWLKRESLEIYSAKACKFLDTVAAELRRDPLIKMLIYHPYIRSSGIMLIGEILAQNGYTAWRSAANSDVYSSELFITNREWIAKYPSAEFKPATYFVLDNSVSDDKKNRMIDEFNSPANKFGQALKFFVGGPKIKQSVDFKDVQVMFIWQVVTNISQYIQIMGRTVRNGAMAALPPSKNRVRLYTLLSTSASGKRTIEYEKYRANIADYEEIQLIEQNIHKSAINNFIQGRHFKSEKPLGSLPFEIKLPEREKASLETYFHSVAPIYAMSLMNALIKRAFIANSVWEVEELWAFISTNPAANIRFAGVNPKSAELYRDLFFYTLGRLVYTNKLGIEKITIDTFNDDNIYIGHTYIAGEARQTVAKVIVQVGKWLVLVPIDGQGNVDLQPYSYLRRQPSVTSITYRLDANALDEDVGTKLAQFEGSHPYLFLLAFTDKEHQALIRGHIEKTAPIPAKYWQIYKRLGLAKETSYVDAHSEYRYEHGTWDSYPKASESHPDNNIVVAVLADRNFKLRPPATAVHVDKRKIQKGMICSTNDKEKLQKYCAKLEVRLGKQEKVHTICERIFIALIDLEIASRSAKDRKKYVYTYAEDSTGI